MTSGCSTCPVQFKRGSLRPVSNPECLLSSGMHYNLQPQFNASPQSTQSTSTVYSKRLHSLLKASPQSTQSISTVYSKRLHSLLKASPQSTQSISTVHNLNHPTNKDNKNEATGEVQSLTDSLMPVTVNRQAMGSHSRLDRMQRSLSVGLHTL